MHPDNPKEPCDISYLVQYVQPKVSQTYIDHVYLAMRDEASNFYYIHL